MPLVSFRDISTFGAYDEANGERAYSVEIEKHTNTTPGVTLNIYEGFDSSVQEAKEDCKWEFILTYYFGDIDGNYEVIQ